MRPLAPRHGASPSHPASSWCARTAGRLGFYEWGIRRPTLTFGAKDCSEPPLTPLGLTPPELAQALGRYRLRLHALIRAIERSTSGPLASDALPALDDFSATLEVDVGARASPAGQSRMSEIERSVLLPLLARLQRQLSLLAHTPPSAAWIPSLKRADEDVAEIERTLAHG